MRSAIGLLTVITAVMTASLGTATAQERVTVGSKRFTESYVLGEILAEVARPYAKIEHRQGLGNTAIVVEALKAGAIDVYVDYTGTIAREILKNPEADTLEKLNQGLAALGWGVAAPLGFENTYAVALTEQRAQALNVRTLSDLAAHPELKLGLSHEFIGRADGWPGLAARYGLKQQPTGLDHGLAYTALSEGRIDAVDVYTTDAEIARYKLRVLEDDRRYFPRYDAVLLYRLDLPKRSARAWQALVGLEGRIDTKTMIALNAQAALEGQAFDQIARRFVSGAQPSSAQTSASTASFARRVFDKTFDAQFVRLTIQHVVLVGVSVLAATLIGVAFGVVAAKSPRLRGSVLGLSGVLQTIPSLALLAMLIPIVGGVGTVPVLITLFVYALLPIVRNTCVGLMEVPQGLKDAARALGLDDRARLMLIELPLARPIMLAGIKTAAITNVGTATIAAFIGAGGYGERIATGLALNDHALLLAGALPAAALALIVQAAFDVFEPSERRTHKSGADR